MKYHARSAYQGKTAAQYDRKRSKRKKWKREISAIRTLAARFEPGTSILDIPVGTGRFLEFYNGGTHTVYGIDVSRDMLHQARAKALALCENNNRDHVYLVMGEAEHIPMRDKSIDYVVCIRMLNWVSKPIFKDIIREFRRVARKGIIIGFRCRQAMKFKDFLHLGMLSVVPTPYRVSRWLKAIARFSIRVVGKIKSLAAAAAGKPQKKQMRNENRQRVFTGKTLYDPLETRAFFSELGLEVEDSFPMDTLPEFFKRKIKPYSIYSMKLNK